MHHAEIINSARVSVRRSEGRMVSPSIGTWFAIYVPALTALSCYVTFLLISHARNLNAQHDLLHATSIINISSSLVGLLASASVS